MKYEKAQTLLPKDIVELIQQYVDGKYIYIPRKTENKKSWGENSGYRDQIKKRNIEILNKHLNGTPIKDLAKEYYLTENSIRRVLRAYKAQNR